MIVQVDSGIKGEDTIGQHPPPRMQPLSDLISLSDLLIALDSSDTYHPHVKVCLTHD